MAGEKCNLMDMRVNEMTAKLGEFGARIGNLEGDIKTTQKYAYDAKISAEKTSVSIEVMLEAQEKMWGHIDTCSDRWANWKGIVLGVGITCTALGTAVAFFVDYLINHGGK